MMLSSLLKTRSAIGLDIGHATIKAVQLEHLGERPRLVAAAVVERLEPGQPLSIKETKRLREVLIRRGFIGRRVVIAAPPDAARCNLLSLPPRDSGAPVIDIARAEMSRAHRVSPEALEVALWDVPPPVRATDGVPTMVAACLHEPAEQILDALEAANFEVIAVDLACWAIARAMGDLLNSPGIVAALDLGYRLATLVLLHQGTVIYERPLGGMGLEPLIETTRRQAQLDPQLVDYLLFNAGFNGASAELAEHHHLVDRVRAPLEVHFDQIAQELRLSLGYAANEYPAATSDYLLLTGAGAAIPGLNKYLAETLQVEVDVLLPAAVCAHTGAQTRDANEPALAIATGLALHEQEVQP